MSHPLTTLEYKNYYQNDSKSNDVYSSNNLPKIKDRVYIINLDEFKSVETNWRAIHVNGNNIMYLIVLELNIFQKKFKNS